VAYELAAIELAMQTSGFGQAIDGLETVDTMARETTSTLNTMGRGVQSTGAKLEDMGKAATGHVPGLAKFERALATIGIAASGANPHIAHLGIAMSQMALGALTSLGIIAGFTALAYLFEKITEHSRESKKRVDELIKSMKEVSGEGLKEDMKALTEQLEAALKAQRAMQSGVGFGAMLAVLLDPNMTGNQAREKAKELEERIADIRKAMQVTTEKADDKHLEMVRKDLDAQLQIEQLENEALNHIEAMARAAVKAADAWKDVGDMTPGGTKEPTTGMSHEFLTQLVRDTQTFINDNAATLTAGTKEAMDAVVDQWNKALHLVEAGTIQMVQSVGDALAQLINLLRGGGNFGSILGGLLSIAGGVISTVGLVTFNPELVLLGAGLGAGGKVVGALSAPGPQHGTQAAVSQSTTQRGGPAFRPPTPAPTVNATIIGPHDRQAQREITELITNAVKNGHNLGLA